MKNYINMFNLKVGTDGLLYGPDDWEIWKWMQEEDEIMYGCKDYEYEEDDGIIKST